MSIQTSLAKEYGYLLTTDQDNDYNYNNNGNQGSGRESDGIGGAVARGASIRSILRSNAAGLALPRIVRRQREVCGGLRHDNMPLIGLAAMFVGVCMSCEIRDGRMRSLNIVRDIFK